MSIQDIKILRSKTGAGFLDCKKAIQATNSIDEAIEWLRKNGIAKAAKKSFRIAAEGVSNILIKGKKAVIVEINSETDFVAKNNDFLELVKEISEVILENEPKSIEDALKLTKEDSTIESLLIQSTAKIGEKISLRRFAISKIKDNQFFGPYAHQGGRISTLTIIEGGSINIARNISMHATALDPTYLFEEEIDESYKNQKLNDFKKEAIKNGKPETIAIKIAMGKLKKELSGICLLSQEFVKGDGESVGKYLKNNNSKLISLYRYSVGEGIEKKQTNFVEEVNSQIKVTQK